MEALPPTPVFVFGNLRMDYLSNEPGLPLIFADGYPASIHSLSLTQLRRFLVYLWTFTDVPEVARLLPHKKSPLSVKVHWFKKAIKAVYDRLGLSYLYHISETIGLKYDRRHIRFQHEKNKVDGQVYVKLYDSREGKYLVTVPRSNLTYDLNAENEELESEIAVKKSDEDVITLIDSDEESNGEMISGGEHIVFQVWSGAQNLWDKKELWESEKTNIKKRENQKNKHSSPLPSPKKKALVESVVISDSSDSDSNEREPIKIIDERSNSSSDFSDPSQDPLATKTENSETIVLSDSDSDSESKKHCATETPKMRNMQIFKRLSHPGEPETKHSPNIRLNSTDTLKIRILNGQDIVKLPNSAQINDIRRKALNNMHQNHLRVHTPSHKDTNSATPGPSKHHCKSCPRRSLLQDLKKKKEIPKYEYPVFVKRTVQPQETRRVPPIVINKDNIENFKVHFLNSLKLYEKDDPLDDVIILPEINKKDFQKYHLLPLNMIQLLVDKEIIDEDSVMPGPIGQNSRYTCNTNLDLDRRKSGRTRSYVNSRFRRMDLTNAIDYKYPTKTYRTRLPVPIPRTRKRRGQPPQLIKWSKRKSLNSTPSQNTEEELKKKFHIKNCRVLLKRLKL